MSDQKNPFTELLAQLGARGITPELDDLHQRRARQFLGSVSETLGFTLEGYFGKKARFVLITFEEDSPEKNNIIGNGGCELTTKGLQLALKDMERHIAEEHTQKEEG